MLDSSNDSTTVFSNNFQRVQGETLQNECHWVTFLLGFIDIDLIKGSPNHSAERSPSTQWGQSESGPAFPLWNWLSLGHWPHLPFPMVVGRTFSSGQTQGVLNSHLYCDQIVKQGHILWCPLIRLYLLPFLSLLKFTAAGRRRENRSHTGLSPLDDLLILLASWQRPRENQK